MRGIVQPIDTLQRTPQSGNTAAARLAAVRARIDAAERQYARAPGSVALLAVSKTQPAERLRELFSLGQRAFGENYLQEALTKQRALADLAIEWHFIGPIQSNKTKSIAEHFDWVHSVDREKVARRLSEQRPEHLPPLKICLQVNISGEASKSGAAPGEVPALIARLAELPRIELRGLMCIPAPADDDHARRAPFRALRELMATLPGLDTLSMGMSDDLEAAVAEGSTLVRVGSALFGPRPTQQ